MGVMDWFAYKHHLQRSDGKEVSGRYCCMSDKQPHSCACTGATRKRGVLQVMGVVNGQPTSITASSLVSCSSLAFLEV